MKFTTTLLLIAVCCLSARATAGSHRFTFIKSDLNDFIAQVEFDLSKQKSFKDYYQTFEQQIEQYPVEKKKLAKREIYNRGLQGLKKEHNDWYTALTPFITDPMYTLDDDFNSIRHEISEFVIRYGLFDDFQQKQVVVVHQEQKPSTFKQVMQKSSAFLQKAGSSIKTVTVNTYSWVKKKVQRVRA